MNEPTSHGRRSDGARTPSTRRSALLADSIAQNIVARAMNPGQRLATEAEMVSEYEVGRATVREALRILEAEGVIEVRPGAHGGPFVAQPDVGRLNRPLSLLLRLSDVTVHEVFEARLTVEPHLAGLAALNRTDEQLDLLRANQARLDSTPRGSETFLTVNREFHSLIAIASRNRPLSAMWTALSTIADGHQVGVRYPPDELSQAVVAHQRIVASIEQKDESAATTAMHEHLSAAHSYIRRYYGHLLDAPVSLVDSARATSA